MTNSLPSCLDTVPGAEPEAPSRVVPDRSVRLPPPRRRTPVRTRIAVRAGSLAAGVSRRCGIGSGGIVGGRVALALAPAALATLARDRCVTLVTGTNGKTTTSHLLAAATRTTTTVAHNDTGANMTDGAVAALIDEPDAGHAVLEVDELHLPVVAAATRPSVVCLLNLTRDQLDRGSEVRAVSEVLRTTFARLPDTTVVADADDPIVVRTARAASRVVWVATGGRWTADSVSCPECGRSIRRGVGGRPAHWACACGLHRPVPQWTVTDTAAVSTAAGSAGRYALDLRLPGRVNRVNATVAMAAASVLGVPPRRSAAAMSGIADVAGRYASLRHGTHDLRLLLVKNPAGWMETLDLLSGPSAALLVVNASEADGRDVSWLWDVDFGALRGRPVVCAGNRGADLGVRLSYAGVAHRTLADPLEALAHLPDGPVDVVANYTAFHQLRRRLAPDVPERAR